MGKQERHTPSRQLLTCDYELPASRAAGCEYLSVMDRETERALLDSHRQNCVANVYIVLIVDLAV
jgi:hypothetical protein